MKNYTLGNIQPTRLIDVIKPRQLWPSYYVLQHKDFPIDVQRRFDAIKKRFMHPDKVPTDTKILGYYAIVHDNTTPHYITYIAHIAQFYEDIWKTEEQLHLYEVNLFGKKIWHWEIRCNISQQWDKLIFWNPFVWYTNTESNYQNQWFGKKRLYTMQKLANDFFALPLHSDTIINDTAKSLWESLVQNHDAVMVQDKHNKRYVFINNSMQ